MLHAFRAVHAIPVENLAGLSIFIPMEPRPVINVEEFIGKTVGRRVAPRDPLRISDSNKLQAMAWKKAFPYRSVPKGVYRFNSHEEAHEWMMKNTGPKRL